ncbi:MAG: tRNA (adenosine(37)-N6)-threonylcarbamoyltransferase complex ATPase subunit type 1 TsaE [Alphaproteobacteria bacterium]
MTPHSAAPQAKSTRWLFDVADENDTIVFARILAPCLQKGDLITLSGDLGSGKTAFARALIRALANNDMLEVPSPTFTFIQTYDTQKLSLIHCDLYRLREPDELIELGFDELSRDSLALVEWASHAPELEARANIDIQLSLKPHTQGIGRAIIVTARGEHISRLKSTMDVTTLLASHGWLSAKRVAIAGDASGRHFERLTKNEVSAILMHAPPPLAGPILRDSKTYRTLARLSDSLGSFVAMAKALREEGVSSPDILAADIENGLALVEDLGVEGLTRDQAPIADRYREAASLLAQLHAKSLPQFIADQEGESYHLPSYDLEPLLTEVELFLEWYYPAFSRVPLSDKSRMQFFNLWRGLIEPCLKDRKTWTLRDFHSPNLFWLSGRKGFQRIGVIDIQDAVYGHPAYDLASLLQDARIAIPETLELKLIKHYADLREAADPAFNLAQFLNAYAIYGAQRVTKILGIFVRLDRRDHKPDYLRHLPHMRAYLKRNLAFPALAPLKTWFNTIMPELFDGEKA